MNPSSIESWMAQRHPSAAQSALIDARLQQYGGGPLLCIVVFDLTGKKHKLDETVRSLAAQAYRRVSVLVVSINAVPVPSSIEHARTIQVEAGNYVPALNEAMLASDADWFMLVHAGEQFTANGLLCAAVRLLEAPDCRALYGDILIRSNKGELQAAFRPDFNHDLLLSYPVDMARHWLVRRDAFASVGGYDAQYADALGCDLALRLVAHGGGGDIEHVAEPLVISKAPEFVDNHAEQAAILRYLALRGQDAELLPSLPRHYRIHYRHVERPLVSVIIPSKNRFPLLQRCVLSLSEQTSYPNYELLIVDDASTEVDARHFLDGLTAMGMAQIRVLPCPQPSSRASLLNFAAQQARGDYLVLLDDGCAMLQPDWLEQLLNHAQRPEVGAVGAKLLRPDGNVASASLLLGLRGPSASPFVGKPMKEPGYMDRLLLDQNCSAVPASCLMVRKAAWFEVGGMNEGEFPSVYHDVDFCLKLTQAGYLNVWTPHATLLHGDDTGAGQSDENLPDESRKKSVTAEEACMYDRWLPQLAHDPAYNRNLALTGAGFELELDRNLNWQPLSWRPLPVTLCQPADPYGCGHYRMIEPFKALEQAQMLSGGLNLGGGYSPIQIEQMQPDVIVLQRHFTESSIDYMKALRRHARAYLIYELDDYMPGLPLKSVFREFIPADIHQSLRRSIAHVDRLVLSTAPLAEALSDLHDNILVVSNSLPVRWWGGLSAQRRVGSKPRVGWAGGAGHRGDLELIADVVRDLADEVEWVFFGMCPDKLRPYVHEYHEGVAIDDYPAKLASLNLDLALAPLEQNLFNECKSNLRLLEYGACGFPVICSDIVCYRGDFPVTRVKNRYRDWVSAIRMHLADLDASAAAGDALREQVRRDWMLSGANLAAWQAAWRAD